MFKLIFLRPWWIFGGFDSRQAYWFIYSRSSGVLRCAVYGQKKAVAPKKPERPQPDRLRQPRRKKAYRRILMRSAPVSGKE